MPWKQAGFAWYHGAQISGMEPRLQVARTTPPLTTDQTNQPTMEELLAEEGRDLIELGRGDVVEGVIVGREAQSLVVDVGAKSEGVVVSNEMHSLTPEQREALAVG